MGCLNKTARVSPPRRRAGAGARRGRDDAVVSVVAGKPVRDEGERADLPRSGCSEPRRDGDGRSKLRTPEEQGGFPRGEQQVQVWRVRNQTNTLRFLDGFTHIEFNIFRFSLVDEVVSVFKAPFVLVTHLKCRIMRRNLLIERTKALTSSRGFFYWHTQHPQTSLLQLKLITKLLPL